MELPVDPLLETHLPDKFGIARTRPEREAVERLFDPVLFRYLLKELARGVGGFLGGNQSGRAHQRQEYRFAHLWPSRLINSRAMKMLRSARLARNRRIPLGTLCGGSVR